MDQRLQGIKMRLRESQRKFNVHDVDEAEFEIARSFDYPNPVHLNRLVVTGMSLLVNTNLCAILQTCSNGVRRPWCG